MIKRMSITVLAFAPFLLSITTPALTADEAGEIKAAYMAKCAVCHAPDGRGNTAYGKKNSMRDLGSKEVQAMSDAKLLQVISKGAGKMPGYAGPNSLGEEMCKKLVGYVRGLAGR